MELLSRTKAVADSGFQMAVVWCSSDPDVADVNVLPTLYPEHDNLVLHVRAVESR